MDLQTIRTCQSCGKKFRTSVAFDLATYNTCQECQAKKRTQCSARTQPVEGENKMKRIKIKDYKEVACAYDIYELYNDFLLDQNYSSEEDAEFVISIRDNYEKIYSKLPEGEYDLYDFEQKAKEIVSSV